MGGFVTCLSSVQASYRSLPPLNPMNFQERLRFRLGGRLPGSESQPPGLELPAPAYSSSGSGCGTSPIATGCERRMRDCAFIFFSPSMMWPFA